MVPALLGLLGTGGAGLAAAPALRALTWPFFALTLFAIGRGWYVHRSHGQAMLWQRRSGIVLAASTVASLALWALRFAGVLGARPF